MSKKPSSAPPGAEKSRPNLTTIKSGLAASLVKAGTAIKAKNLSAAMLLIAEARTGGELLEVIKTIESKLAEETSVAILGPTRALLDDLYFDAEFKGDALKHTLALATARSESRRKICEWLRTLQTSELRSAVVLVTAAVEQAIGERLSRRTAERVCELAKYRGKDFGKRTRGKYPEFAERIMEMHAGRPSTDLVRIMPALNPTMYLSDSGMCETLIESMRADLERAVGDNIRSDKPKRIIIPPKKNPTPDEKKTFFKNYLAWRGYRGILALFERNEAMRADLAEVLMKELQAARSPCNPQIVGRIIGVVYRINAQIPDAGLTFNPPFTEDELMNIYRRAVATMPLGPGPAVILKKIAEYFPQLVGVKKGDSDSLKARWGATTPPTNDPLPPPPPDHPASGDDAAPEDPPDGP